MKRIKKAFTLVELVVVIAVIAVLSALSIVSYSNITISAKKSNDQQLLTTINTALTIKESLDGHKPNTMHEAVNNVKDELGVNDISKFLSTSYKDFEFAWDDEANRFVLLEGNKVAFKDTNYDNDFVGREYHFWKLTNSINENAVYSQYLVNNDLSGNFTVKAGLDIGENINIINVSYADNNEDNKNIILRTNSFDSHLVINSINDSVKHYGLSFDVNLNGGNLSEYGESVGSVFVHNGSVNIMKGCKSSGVVVNLTQTELDLISLIKINNHQESSIPVIVNPVVNEEIQNGTKVTIETPLNKPLILEGSNKEAYVVEDNLYYESLKDAIASSINSNIFTKQNHKHIIVLKDSEIEGDGYDGYALNKEDFILNLNNHNVTLTNGSYDGFYFAKNPAYVEVSGVGNLITQNVLFSLKGSNNDVSTFQSLVIGKGVTTNSESSYATNIDMYSQGVPGGYGVYIEMKGTDLSKFGFCSSNKGNVLREGNVAKLIVDGAHLTKGLGLLSGFTRATIKNCILNKSAILKAGDINISNNLFDIALDNKISNIAYVYSSTGAFTNRSSICLENGIDGFSGFSHIHISKDNKFSYDKDPRSVGWEDILYYRGDASASVLDIEGNFNLITDDDMIAKIDFQFDSNKLATAYFTSTNLMNSCLVTDIQNVYGVPSVQFIKKYVKTSGVWVEQ